MTPAPGRLRWNFTANAMGSAWAAFLQLAFLPVYVRLLGMEAFGLIGVFASLQAWMAVLDMGMTPTLTRETARGSAGPARADLRPLVGTLELLIAAIACAQWFLLWAASGWLATHWLRVAALPVPVVARAIAVMGGVLAARWISGLYRGGLMGFQRQVPLNAAGAGFAALRAAGVVPVLWASPSINTFFVYQGAVSLAELLFLRTWLWRQLPGRGFWPRFSAPAFHGVKRFAGGMTLITLLGALLMQTDKLLLSTLLPLEAFGRYALASTVASALLFFVTPVTGAYLPRLTQLVYQENEPALKAAYHQGSRLLSTLVLPAGIILAVFSDVVLRLWLRDARLAAAVSPLVQLLAVGYILNGVLHMPYQLQLAYGWTRLAIAANTASVLLLAPAVLWLAPRYGAWAAAACWAAVNAGQFWIATPAMHRRLLKGEYWSWVWRDTGRPAAAALVVAFTGRWLLDAAGFVHPLGILVFLGAVGAGALVLAAVWSGLWPPRGLPSSSLEAAR